MKSNEKIVLRDMDKDALKYEIKRLRKIIRKQGLEIAECNEVIELLKSGIRGRFGDIVLTKICKEKGIKHIEEVKEACNNPTETKFIRALGGYATYDSPKTFNSTRFFMNW
jgi:peroxiredoxin family protein